MSSKFSGRGHFDRWTRYGFYIFPVLFAVSFVQAQDAIRPSLAGEASAEARRQSIDHIPYNLLVGPIRFRVSATMGMEFNDNVNIAEVNPQSDFILRPQVNVNALWPVTQLNTLRLDIGMGYGFYTEHPSYDTNGLLLSPGSALAFDIFVSDFRINIHDRFSLEQDPIDEAQLSGVADYGRFQNTGGISVLWDLNKAVVTFGFDHYNFVSTTDRFDYLNRGSEIVTASASVAASSTTGVGLESSYIYNAYNQDVLNDSNNYTVGAFVETQISNYMKLRVAAGYQNMTFAGDVDTIDLSDGSMLEAPDSSELSDYYVNVLLSHRINAAITQTLSAGHEAQLGVNSNYVELNYVRHTVTWNVINHTLITTELFYEDGEDSGGFIDEHFHRFGGALSIGYQLTRHVTLGARYQYTQKDSDVPFRDYNQNRVALDGTYSF